MSKTFAESAEPFDMLSGLCWWVQPPLWFAASHNTFSRAFKRKTELPVTAWMKAYKEPGKVQEYQKLQKKYQNLQNSQLLDMGHDSLFVAIATFAIKQYHAHTRQREKHSLRHLSPHGVYLAFN